jgi:hypothetical protein
MTDCDWTFSNPIGEKQRNATGNVISVFTFNIQKAREYNETITATADSLQKTVFTPALISSYLLDMYGAFLKVHSSKFAKSYTPAQLIRITRHTFKALEEFEGISDWTFVPAAIEITSNTFNIIWHGRAEPKIELVTNDDLEEIDVDGMVSANLSDNDFLRLNSPEKLRAIQRLEKAKLKMKISKFRLEKAVTNYISKYGDLDENMFSSSDEDEGATTDYGSDSD